MARKGQVSIQDNIEDDDEYEEYLKVHQHQLICMEVYADFCGPCLATGNAVRKGKMEIGLDAIAMCKAMSDNITALARFKGKSEPVFLFIHKGNKLSKVVFGANGIELCLTIEEELKIMRVEHDAKTEMVKKYPINEVTPMETAKFEQRLLKDKEHREAAQRLKVLTLAARKKRVLTRLADKVRQLNFILFWPLHHQAHYDLYEKWDMINISVAAKETFQLTEEMARECLYMSDVDPNDACIHALITGEVLVVLFKMFESDERDFVKLMRRALYEEIPVPKEDVPPEKQLPPIPAYERYASISKTAREVRRDRYNAKMQKLREEQEERDRLKREQERLIREAKEEEERLLKQKQEEERMARIAAGLPAEAEPEEGEPGEGGEGGEGGAGEEAEKPAEGAEEVKEEEHEVIEAEFHSDVEVEGEDYIPPGGLFVPGLYSAPNDMAKANGLRLFYPKIVSDVATLESEIMPPHVLVMFPVEKRHEVIDVINNYRDEILNYGFFLGDIPQNMQHVAYTVKQYDKMTRLRKHLDRMALMVSRKRSLPLLQLAGLGPIFISGDTESGEKDCLTIFPVGYGDEYVEEESVKEEEIEEVVQAVTEVKEEAPPPEEAVEEEEELEMDM